MIHYNVVISAYADFGNVDMANTVFGEMGAAGIEPDVISCNAVITASGRAADWEKALLVLQLMPNQGVEPNVISYNAAMSACEKAGRWEEAVGLLREMEESVVEPDVYSYSAGMSACEKAGRCEEAVTLFDEMVERNIEPSVVSYNAVIEAVDSGGQERRAVDIFRRAVASGVYRAQNRQQDGRAGAKNQTGAVRKWRANRCEIDLHHLPAAVARAAVVVAIEDHEEEAAEGSPIRIITGRGLNSDGEAPVRPAVLELLGREEYAHLTREDDAKSKGGAIFVSWPVQ